MARFDRLLVALAALGAAACRHGAEVAPIERGELRGILLAPAPTGRETQSILADGPIASLVANNSMGLVGNNSMGFGDLLPPGMRIQAARGGAGVPVVGALVRLVDGKGRQIPGVSIGFTARRGAFRLLGVPVGRRAVVEAGWSVQGAVQVELAIVLPAGGRIDVLVDAPSSVAAAWALERADGRVDALEPDRVESAAALLRQRPEVLGEVDLSSRAALAAAFGQAAAADPDIAMADPVPDLPRPAVQVPAPSSPPEPTPAPTLVPTPAQALKPSPSPTAVPTPAPTELPPSPAAVPTSAPTEPPRPAAHLSPPPGAGEPDPWALPLPDTGDPDPTPPPPTDTGDPPGFPGEEFGSPPGWDPFTGLILAEPDPTEAPP